jgi:hypothetical protein
VTGEERIRREHFTGRWGDRGGQRTVPAIGWKLQNSILPSTTAFDLHAASVVDLLVEECVIVEVKAVQTLTPLCAAQLIAYLKLKRCSVGLLLNFNVAVLRHGVRRFTNRAADQHSSAEA